MDAMTPSAWTQNGIILLAVVCTILALRRAWNSERWSRPRNRFRKEKLGRISLGIVLAYAFVGVLDLILVGAHPQLHTPATVLDWMLGYPVQERGYSAPWAQTTLSPFQPTPLKQWHLLGTDALGKDVLLQTLKACRTALFIGGLTSLIYVPLGTLFGVLAGYYRRWVDDLIQYIYSTLASVPSILLLIAIMMVLGRGIPQLAIALGITNWVGLCRLIRGETMRQAGFSYVDAARALGQSPWQIMFRQILPNTLPLVMINFILGFSGLISVEAILSYLGIGVPVGTASWGSMIDSARMELAREPIVWWNFSAAIVALFVLVLALNLLGDALRRAFDPKSS